MERVIIAAVAENGVIGKDGGIPWDYPEDFNFFKQTTTGHPVIMGRTTYEGIVAGLGEPLPDRTSIVLSHEELDEPENVGNVHSIDDALEAAENTGGDTVYIAGGATIYEQFLEEGYVDKMLITQIPESPDGDTYFPDWDEEQWKVADREELTDELDVVTYVRA